jgi:perosamine synthetase
VTDSIVCLSVRTAFDLYLRVKNFPLGSEILMSAINIPDMSVVVAAHGLIPIPVDIDPATLIPLPHHLEKLRTDKTVAILVAHLWGRRIDLESVFHFAAQHRLPLIEDCAEAFCGLVYRGDPRSDLSLFSFGSIKIATAFGGAMVRVKDAHTLKEMRRIHDTYPVLSRMSFLKKVCRNTALLAVLNNPPIVGTVSLVSRHCNYDVKKRFVGLLRGFPGDDLIQQLRFQPSDPLLATLWRRFTHFDENAYAQGVRNGDALVNEIKDITKIPGEAALVRHYWLFPIIVEDPDWFLAELNRQGVDAYRGATQLALVNAPSTPTSSTAPLLFPENANELMRKVIYLPMHRAVTRKHMENIARIVKQTANRQTQSKEPVRSKL